MNDKQQLQALLGLGQLPGVSLEAALQAALPGGAPTPSALNAASGLEGLAAGLPGLAGGLGGQGALTDLNPALLASLPGMQQMPPITPLQVRE